ncbi:cysteine hydrolase family protein [Blastochloris tepida]|uniref:Isochorismatase n=1 Tax=Blastochloris tepida TaxID=2233851 RepID=A0A348G2J6_9HYPH|nr:cysteine hydrolase family protein [Blastochloris tepida]BBF93779.1 isochorismatase [Blastochloris tepida]
MTAPRTLRDLVGAPSVPPRLADAVVVVVDAQREYVDGHLPLVGVHEALARLADVLAAARAAGAPVIHVQHRGAAGGAFDPAGPGFAFADPAAPVTGERVVEKTQPNSFAGTDLAEAVAETGSRQIVLVGFMTHMCVSTTARAALDHGLGVTVIADACATRHLPDPTGGPVIPAAEIHRVALAELADRFAIVCRASDLKR